MTTLIEPLRFYDADGNLDLTKIPTAPASLTTELVHYVVLCCIGVANSGKSEWVACQVGNKALTSVLRCTPAIAARYQLRVIGQHHHER
jgi:hypothetical protein